MIRPTAIASAAPMRARPATPITLFVGPEPPSAAATLVASPELSETADVFVRLPGMRPPTRLSSEENAALESAAEVEVRDPDEPEAEALGEEEEVDVPAECEDRDD